VAIDSEDKRRSVHGYTMTPIYPVADGSVDTQDRPHVGWIYRGFTIAAAFVNYTADHAIGVLFRDKRIGVPFRDKRVGVPFRDKRVAG
jgi:hypothetical protein